MIPGTWTLLLEFCAYHWSPLVAQCIIISYYLNGKTVLHQCVFDDYDIKRSAPHFAELELIMAGDKLICYETFKFGPGSCMFDPSLYQNANSCAMYHQHLAHSDIYAMLFLIFNPIVFCAMQLLLYTICLIIQSSIGRVPPLMLDIP